MRILLAAAVVIAGAADGAAIEEAAYRIVKKDNRFEIRDYEACILAETVVAGDFAQAGSKAFNKLFRYISGANRIQGKIPMTAPVSQQAQGENIAMTSPVGQQQVQRGWAVSFMMPASYTLETLPEPEDPEITLRRVPARRMAVVMYSGFWSEKRYLKYRELLESWIREEGLTIADEPVWARYNPPFTPWFLRRNEIQIPVAVRSD